MTQNRYYIQIDQDQLSTKPKIFLILAKGLVRYVRSNFEKIDFNEIVFNYKNIFINEDTAMKQSAFNSPC